MQSKLQQGIQQGLIRISEDEKQIGKPTDINELNLIGEELKKFAETI